MEDQDTGTEEIELNDVYLVAVFAAANSRSKDHPFKIQPFLTSENKVSWRISGVGIMQTLEGIYSDTPVPVLSFIKSVKEIRSSIFIYKGISQKRQG